MKWKLRILVGLATTTALVIAAGIGYGLSSGAGGRSESVNKTLKPALPPSRFDPTPLTTAWNTIKDNQSELDRLEAIKSAQTEKFKEAVERYLSSAGVTGFKVPILNSGNDEASIAEIERAARTAITKHFKNEPVEKIARSVQQALNKELKSRHQEIEALNQTIATHEKTQITAVTTLLSLKEPTPGSDIWSSSEETRARLLDCFPEVVAEQLNTKETALVEKKNRRIAELTEKYQKPLKDNKPRMKTLRPSPLPPRTAKEGTSNTSYTRLKERREEQIKDWDREQQTLTRGWEDDMVDAVRRAENEAEVDFKESFRQLAGNIQLEGGQWAQFETKIQELLPPRWEASTPGPDDNRIMQIARRPTD